MALVKRTLLQLVNAAQSELGLTTSTSIVGNTSDVTAVQMLALIQSEIEELYQEHTWTVLQTEYNLIVNVPLITTGTMAAGTAVITGITAGTSTITPYDFAVSANGLPVAARVKSVDSSSQVTLTMSNTNSTAVTATVTFSQDTYPEPNDFGRMIDQTWYDRTNRWRLLGPDSPQQDQFVRSGIVALGPRRHFRQIGQGPGFQSGQQATINGSAAASYRIWPPPTELVTPLQLVFEYITANVIVVGGVGGTYSNTWTSDTDLCLLDDRALIHGLKYRYWQQKGFNWADLKAVYDAYVNRLKAFDGGSKTLSIVPRMVPFLIDVTNVQDSNFPTNTNVNSNGT